MIPEYVPPNPDMIAIARLYLERYTSLAEEDKRVYRQMLTYFPTPVMAMPRRDYE